MLQFEFVIKINSYRPDDIQIQLQNMIQFCHSFQQQFLKTVRNHINQCFQDSSLPTSSHSCKNRINFNRTLIRSFFFEFPTKIIVYKLYQTSLYYLTSLKLKLLEEAITLRMPYQFTKHQTNQLRKQFSQFDADDDFNISIKQCAALLQSLGKPSSDHDIKKFISEVDADKNGVIEFSEFLAFLGKEMFHLEYHTDLQETFYSFDLDNDGKISPNDLKKAIKNNGYDKVTNDKLNQMVIFMMNEVDIDQDGHINFNEFVTIMESI